MSDFSFEAENFQDSNAFLVSAGERQTNRTPNNKEMPLKTTQSQRPPKETLTVFSISDAASNSALMKPVGASSDVFNRVGQDAIAVGIADGGGVETVMGAYKSIAPTDLILKAENIAPSDPSRWNGMNSGVAEVGQIDPGNASISAQGWAMPVASHTGGLSSSGDFGPRPSPGNGVGSTNHKGIDLKGGTGEPIKAAKGGTVTQAGTAGGYGNAVYIDHGEGISSRYAHMSKVNCSVGDQVMANQVIGLVGSTGNSTGPHLHFEIRENGTAIDPAPFLGL